MRKMRFEVKDALTEEEFHHGLRGFIKDGLRPMVMFLYSILRDHLKKIRREDIRRWIGT